MDLYAWTAKQQRSRAAITTVLRKVRHALDLIHRRGILFGDINPGNVIIGEGGRRVWLVDWETAQSTADDLDALANLPVMLQAWQQGML
jgi:RIO-like serine/threonine protein kinase